MTVFFTKCKRSILYRKQFNTGRHTWGECAHTNYFLLKGVCGTYMYLDSGIWFQIDLTADCELCL